MSEATGSRLAEVVAAHEASLLSEWVTLQAGAAGGGNRLDDRQLREHSREFLSAFRAALQSGTANMGGTEWRAVDQLLEQITNVRLNQGFTPSEVATFVFSLKQPIFSRLREEFRKNADALAAETWTASTIIDQLGLFTTEVYQRLRNEIILRQQQEMMELSTPVVQLWGGILALPLIGTLDSARTQVVMQNLLEAIVEKESQIAIIDITGVPTVDTLVAQHLLKTVAAARLMGADCIISGIRPQIAQTIIHLGVDLANVTTKATLADALSTALTRVGASIVITGSAQASRRE